HHRPRAVLRHRQGSGLLVLAPQRLPLHRQPGGVRRVGLLLVAAGALVADLATGGARPPRPQLPPPPPAGRPCPARRVRGGPDEDRLPAQPHLSVPGLAALRLHRVGASARAGATGRPDVRLRPRMTAVGAAARARGGVAPWLAILAAAFAA